MTANNNDDNNNVQLVATLHNCKNNRAEKRCRDLNEVVNINEEIFQHGTAVAMFGFNIVINQLLMYLIKFCSQRCKYVENLINMLAK